MVCSTVHHSFQLTAFCGTSSRLCTRKLSLACLSSVRVTHDRAPPQATFTSFCGSLKRLISVNSDTWPLHSRPHDLSTCVNLPGLAKRRDVCHAQCLTVSGITLHTHSTDIPSNHVSRFGIVSQPSGTLAQFFQHWHFTPSVCHSPCSGLLSF